MINAIKRALTASKILESPYMVIHAAMPNSWKGETDWDAARQVNYGIFAELLDEAKKQGVKLALENMPLARIPTGMPDQLCEYVDMMNSDYMVACLDTGHANITGIPSGEFVRKLGSRLKTLHIHDNLGLNPYNEGWSDMHTAPYLGNIDWVDFSHALREIGYDGTLSYETDTFLARQSKESFPVALRYLRDLIEIIEKL
jgi:sugar phosphate isomerase/epimerase